MSIISLLTDFGQKDPYVAEMKAVILSINSTVRLVDITHQVTKFSIAMGAYCLACAAPYFPSQTVHVAVVDPGVGTKRRSIIIQTQRSLYVGPDNGVLVIAAQKETITHVYCIQNPKYLLPTVSSTFHGRDIFAPVAAHLTRGIKPSEFGPEIHDYLVPEFAKQKTKTGKIIGKVLHIDDFGNIISNISQKELEPSGIKSGDYVQLVVGSKTMIVCFCSVYGEVSLEQWLVVVGSSGFVELALNQGSASKALDANVGDKFCLSVIKS